MERSPCVKNELNRRSWSAKEDKGLIEKMERSPRVKNEVNRRSWSDKEDKILENYIKAHGEGRWKDLPKKAGLFYLLNYLNHSFRFFFQSMFQFCKQFNIL